MKWFCGLNEHGPHFQDYAEMLLVAIESVRGRGLDPHLLYDGGDRPQIRELETAGWTVIRRQSFLRSDLERLGEQTANPAVMWYGPGVFLRTEIPALALERGWSDSHVLYTDCDVMFTPRFNPDDLPRPEQFFAVAPEGDPNNTTDFNSGVMVMHLPSLREVDGEFRARLRADLPESVRADWDQYSYRRFFRDRHERLGVEFNWKPYWGENGDARIVHFHGPKPFVRPVLRSGTASAVQMQLANDFFWRLCDDWDLALKCARNGGLAPPHSATGQK